MKSTDTKEFTPFQSIGLCFSGGGYRAAFFSLGTLKYLHQTKYNDQSLLDAVQAISSVSGGTITAVAFAKAYLSPNFDFDRFYNSFTNEFSSERDSLLEDTINKLQDDKIWKTNLHKKRSLINSLALAYEDRELFQGNFELLQTDNKSIEFCFNATEFSNGLPFRFQNGGRFGNRNFRVEDALSAKIRMSDIIAASSCFPLGFEPIIFPDDFFKNKKTPAYKELKEKASYVHGVGLMDGGISDNQGIGSMINMHNRNNYDLIMSCDVASYHMEPWEQEEVEKKSRFTIQGRVLKLANQLRFKWIFPLLLVIGILMVYWAGIDIHFRSENFNIEKAPWGNGVYLVGGILIGLGVLLTSISLLASIIMIWGRNKINTIFQKTVPEALTDEVLAFQKLNIGLVQRMLSERFSSGIKMVNEVFLKRIRKLNYDLFYQTSSLKNRRITSTVYQLNGKERLSSELVSKEMIEAIGKPSKKVNQVALEAQATQTSVWWDEDDIAVGRMNKLIACGQFTTCFNLMLYILKLKKNGISSEHLEQLYKTLQTDWNKFNKDPMFKQ